MRKFSSLLLLVSFLAAISPAALAAAPPPAEPGPYPVGVTTFLLVDHSRTCPQPATRPLRRNLVSCDRQRASLHRGN